MSSPNSDSRVSVEQWGTRIGVIMAVAGSAVGIGNYLRFPGLAAQHGGGAFMIPYFAALLILGILFRGPNGQWADMLEYADSIQRRESTASFGVTVLPNTAARSHCLYPS